MLRQSVAVQNWSGASHNPVKMQKEPLVVELGGQGEMTAVDPYILPGGGVPFLPGE